jgi:hypothetical protein
VKRCVGRVGGVVKGCEYTIRLRSFGVSGWGPFSREFGGIYCQKDAVLTEIETVRNAISLLDPEDVSRRVEALNAILGHTPANPAMQLEALRTIHAALQAGESRRATSKHCDDVRRVLTTVLAVVKQQSFHQRIAGTGLQVLQYCCKSLWCHGE